MTAHQLHAHAAQILQLTLSDNNLQIPNSTAVIDLQQQHTPAGAGTNGGGGIGYSNAGAASHDSQAATPENSAGNKRKRRPAGTPDPDAEVVALSPKTLMESDRYICEICNQGFQRDQNLQMHRRRHKVPWKLLKKARFATHKRVYVCPELTCLHHDPAHALGDLVGIKKHFRRKHCSDKQWVCDKCSKGYAVQSDYKAHLKTCGTRGHCCDCGRVFSRVESFIEHQDTCGAAKQKSSMQSGNDSKSTLQRSTTTTSRRNLSSTESPSQSSADTSPAALFTISGISDNTSPPMDQSSRLNEEGSTRFESSTSHAPTTVIPPWLPEQWNELQQLLPSTTQAHRLESYSSEPALATTAHDMMRLQGVSGSRSQITRCSSKNSGSICPEVSISECKSLKAPRCLSVDDLDTPSLQLTIGPYSTKSTEVISSDYRVQYVTPEGTIDGKPNRNTVDKLHHVVQAVALSNSKQLRGSAAVEVAITTAGSNSGTNADLPLPFPLSASVQTPVYNNDIIGESKIRKASATVSVNDFRTSERFGLARTCEEISREQQPSINIVASQQELAARLRSSDSPGGITTASASSSFHTPYGSRGLSSQEDLRERKESETVRENFIWDQRRSIAQQSPLQAAQVSAPEPDNNTAASTDLVHKQHSRDCNLPDVSASEFLIVARTLEEASAQKELAATAFTEANKAREQARTEMNTAWSDLAAARRTKEQARLESTEAQNEIARAELLKREAREQVQQASVEKAFADHARDMAKRQMDIAEAELADAKRIREQAQAEIEKSRLLKDQQSRELCSPLEATIRVNPRDHNLQSNSSNYICEVCKSVPVGGELALGLQHSTNRTPMMPFRVASWPRSIGDQKMIRFSQNTPNEISTRTGVVNYLTTRESTSELSPMNDRSRHEPNPTRLLSHMVGERSTCGSWSVASRASDAGEGRPSSSEFLEASVPTFATFATSTTVQEEAPSTSKNPRISTDHDSQSHLGS